MNITSLRGLFIHELKDLYSAEKQLTEAIPKMSKAASSSSLKQALDNHLDVTRRQLERVGQLLTSLNENPGDVTCVAMKGLINEGERLLKDNSDNAVKDAAIISAAQRVEHYEISAYGTARAFAEALGEDDAASVLQEILDEESEANETLNDIALDEVNPHALESRGQSVA